jgi:hypothetical protein
MRWASLVATALAVVVVHATARADCATAGRPEASDITKVSLLSACFGPCDLRLDLSRAKAGPVDMWAKGTPWTATLWARHRAFRLDGSFHLRGLAVQFFASRLTNALIDDGFFDLRLTVIPARFSDVSQRRISIERCGVTTMLPPSDYYARDAEGKRYDELYLATEGMILEEPWIRDPDTAASPAP